MPTPTVAGALALLQQPRPEWDVADLNAALMNTARDVISNDATAVSPGALLTMVYSETALRANQSTGVLLFHYHNTHGQRMEATTFPSAATSTGVYLPIVNR